MLPTVSTAEEMILAAIKGGFKTIGISEHIGHDGWDDPKDRLNFKDNDAYLEMMYALKEKYKEQIRIAKEVLHSRRHSSDIHKLVKGLMIESYIVDGAQPASCGTYGQSITDPCLGWEKTERLILDIAEKL